MQQVPETRVDEAPILVIAVSYNTNEQANRFAALVRTQQGQTAQGQRVHLHLADNSPSLNPHLADLASTCTDGSFCYSHFPHNPFFSGAGCEVLTNLAAVEAPLPYAAVVLANVDLRFSLAGLVELVDDASARVGDTRWVLAPDIRERGRRWRLNPQRMERTGEINARRRDRWRSESVSANAAFLQAYALRRRWQKNPWADVPAFTPIYAAAGAFTIFGAGYFTSGGVLHEAPLFGEEFAFAEMAHAASVPVFYTPDLVVHHDAEASTAPSATGYQRRYDWYTESNAFYRAWSPTQVMGVMQDWFPTW